MKTILAGVLLVLLSAAPGAAADLVNYAGASKIALNGYDPVAFFIDSKPAHGSPEIAATHRGVSYLFASEEHKKLFTARPDKYVPQFGGFCAMGAALGTLLPVDVTTWQVRDDKLYLNLNPDVAKTFNADAPGSIAKAEKNWPQLVKKHAK